MSEPTIYKPSIYNGNGVYKNGASGGGVIKKIYEIGNYIVDKNGYIGDVVTPNYATYTNIAYVVDNADFSNLGKGQVHFLKKSNVLINGISYETVEIDGIIWTCENLRNEFDEIPIYNSSNFPSTPGMWWFQDDRDSALEKKYGALYNHYAVDKIMNDGLLTEGWRISSDSDQTKLVNYLAANGGLKIKSSIQKFIYGWNGLDLYDLFILNSGSLRGVNYWHTGDANYWNSTNNNNMYFDNTDNIGRYPDPEERAYSLRLCKDA